MAFITLLKDQEKQDTLDTFKLHSFECIHTPPPFLPLSLKNKYSKKEKIFFSRFKFIFLLRNDEFSGRSTGCVCGGG